MTPVWIFPAYPLLLVGPLAAVLARNLSQQRSLEVVISGLTLQGTGFMVALMIYSAFIYRLMTQKLPQESLRPGMFVSVGPSAFTVSALINMAGSLDRALPDDFMGNGQLAGFVLKIMANWAGIWLWG
jgi:tellurite resistance protein TehA-like permease